jgi:hypothetical protein
MSAHRLVDLHTRDDGVNAWRTARISAPSALANENYGYSDHWTRTGGVTARRQLPHAEGVPE